jgi:hypothetical protein
MHDAARASSPIDSKDESRRDAPDAAEMWENLCRADEILGDCELLAASMPTDPPKGVEKTARE